MAPLRTSSTGLVAGGLALLTALGLAGFPLFTSSKALPATVPLAFFALAALVVGLVRNANTAVVFAVATMAAEYWVALHTLDDELSLYAGGLVLVAELASWSAAETIREIPRARIPSRVLWVASLAAASATVAAALVVTAKSVSASSVWLEPIGLAAAAATVFVVALLARRPSGEQN
jgi:hypothetical protein